MGKEQTVSLAIHEPRVKVAELDNELIVLMQSGVLTH